MRSFIAGFCLVLLFSAVAHAKIVFAREPDRVKGDVFIYVMDDDGSNVTQLTQTKFLGHPRWSPDGRQIVFTSNSIVYLMNADGSNIRQLTHPVRLGHNRESDRVPTFLPTGQSILFERKKKENGKYKIKVCVINIASGKIKTIAEFDSDMDKISVSKVDWSPDGKHIVFSTPIGLGGEWSGNIWIMDADGDNIRELTEPIDLNGVLQIDQSRPRWSPDGKKVLYAQQEFTFEPGDEPNSLWINRKAFRYIVCDRKGKTLQRLGIPKDFRSVSLDWMDHGKSVLLTGYKYKLNKRPQAQEKNVPFNMYKYNIRTGEMKRLTDHPGDDWTVDWISDDVLPVNPEGKMQTQWGAIKKFLQNHSEAFKSLSQNALFFLRNQH